MKLDVTTQDCASQILGAQKTILRNIARRTTNLAGDGSELLTLDLGVPGETSLSKKPRGG